jgi:hypothetical protein
LKFDHFVENQFVKKKHDQNDEKLHFDKVMLSLLTYFLNLLIQKEIFCLDNASRVFVSALAQNVVYTKVSLSDF